MPVAVFNYGPAQHCSSERVVIASETSRSGAAGAAFAAGAYTLWGIFPVYFRLVGAVPAVEMLAHRVVWSAGFVALLLCVRRGWTPVAAALAKPELLATLAASAAVISVNWGTFIWAVGQGRVLECSLGYFINPLVSVLLGVMVLRERLRLTQWMAVLLAGAGVAIEVVSFGTLPWIALNLAFSFGLYGLIRKTAPVDPLSGLIIETLLLSLLALGLLGYLANRGTGAFASNGWQLDALIALAGPVTALPLLLFVAGARRIRLSTLGLLQYIAPTGHFLLAVLAYGEALTAAHLATFGCIWLALAIYTATILRREPRPIGSVGG